MPSSTHLLRSGEQEESISASSRPYVKTSVDVLAAAPNGTAILIEAKDLNVTNADRPRVSGPRVFRASEVPKHRFTLLQKWDGCVLEADDATFTARLIDGNGAFPTQQAVFSRDELSPEEESLVTPGAPFVWTIGYRHRPNRERVSSLYFRRLPTWSAEELKNAAEKGKELASAIGWK
jgi:hypothetical protein